jgi:hypothetical protein
MEENQIQTITVKAIELTDFRQFDDALKIQQIMVEYTRKQMIKGTDYGIIPYTKKPTLLKPGAEKLCRLFKLRPRFTLVESIVNYENQLFHYHYRCQLFRNNELVGEGDGLANSKEKKFQRNPFDYSVVNTVCKMAQKRALVAVVLISCGASEFFTQDLEDYPEPNF